MHFFDATRTYSYALIGLLALCACQSAENASSSPANGDGNIAAAAQAATVPKAQAQRMRFPVSGMVCDGCEHSIRGAVEKLEGVVACTASHQAQEAIIEFDPARVTPERLSETITKLGYQVGQGEKVSAALPGQTAPSAPGSPNSPN